jgi:hypothetical protein
VRAQFYAYAYTSGEAKDQGLWWERHLLGLYFPTVHLKGE